MNIPKLKKIKTTKNYHGITLEDDYSWVDQPNILEVLKDPKKLDKEVVLNSMAYKWNAVVSDFKKLSRDTKNF